ncbi:MAG TPA: TIM-barrel domain-containing protein [Terracidiphilus sp.]|nr:TIM-barrel domain-containing protein [Terracidiphilus sp.]
MKSTLSRRKLLQTASASAAGLLISRRITPAEAAIAGAEAGLPKHAPQPNIRTGDAGLQLTVVAISQHLLRITLAAVDETIDKYFDDGSLTVRSYPGPLHSQRADQPAQPNDVVWGNLTLHIETMPLRLSVRHPQRGVIQEFTFRSDTNQVLFQYGNAPVYGLGPGTHPLDRRGTKDIMRNGAGDDLRIFGARNPIPWLMGKGWGLYFHLPAGQFDLTGETGIWHPSDGARAQDIFIAIGDTPSDLLRQYAELTGYPHLPARWTFGFQQSHRTIESRQQILDEARTFREKKLPCDTMIYLGTGFCPSGWNTGHGSFVFNHVVFPDPEQIVTEFHDLHFNVVLHVVNPPENLHGSVHDTGSAAAVAGDAANYWAQHEPFVHMGHIDIDGWWPDEGDILPTPSRLVRNRMYWEGGRKTRPDRRPFALHRNCYAGIQRWGWLWSGDTNSTWTTLETQIMEGINAGLNGVPFWGTDIGGFVPTREFTAELFVRWFQFGAFCPSFRCHGRTWQLRRPWGWNTGSYGPSEMGPNAASFLPQEQDLHNAAVEPICRKFLETRYRLLPYIYSAAWETHTKGLPMIRSLGLAFPEDEQAWATADAFLFGPSLLVAPVYERGAVERTVTLPAGSWWDFWSSQRMEGGHSVTLPAPLDSLPLLVRAGSILPTGPIKQYAEEPSSEPITLTVYPGADGEFLFYDDDGLTFAYERGDFQQIAMSWNDAQKTLTMRQSKDTRMRQTRFVVKLAGGEARTITLGPGRTTVKLG